MKKFIVNMEVGTYIDVEVEADTKVEALEKVLDCEYLNWDFIEDIKFRDLDILGDEVLVYCPDDENDDYEEVKFSN